MLMVCVKDIAAACGVNPATVSRALNDQKGVSEPVREIIKQKAGEMGYRRYSQAMSLNESQRRLIGVIVPDISNPYYANIAKGVASAVEPEYCVILCNTDRNPDKERSYVSMLCDYHVCGVIIVSVTAAPSDLQPFITRKIKTVCVDNPIGKQFSCILNDNYTGTCDLIEHMVATAGIKRLAAVMGYANAFTTQQRYRACLDTLSRLNCSDCLIKTFNINPTYEEGYRICPQVFAAEPDGIFAINDTVALGILAYCHDHKIKVPQDIKIAGYDDIHQSAMLSVPLTTVHQRKFVLGQKAGAQLLSEIADPDKVPIKIELFPRLMIRASCGEEFMREIE